MTQQENDELMYASPEDQEFYLKAVHGLPFINGYSMDGLDSEGIPMCFGVGPHSVRCFREILNIVKPVNIFEIGTNVSYSAALWLELGDSLTTIFTCDISRRKETEDAAKTMKERYGERYCYVNRNDEQFNLSHCRPIYDLAFIDGDHSKEGIAEDLKQCIDLKIRYIAFDDWLPQFGATQEVIPLWSDYIEQVKILGNIALYKNKSIQ